VAGLLVDAGSAVVKNQAANTAFAITPDGFSWGDYEVSADDDGWLVTGPHNAYPLPSLSPSSTDALEDKEFTPVYPGRYVVQVKATETATGTQHTYKCLIEVASAYFDEGVPAPLEGKLYDATLGWAPSISKALATLQQSLRHQVVKIKNGTGSTIAARSIVQVTGFVQYEDAGSSGEVADERPDTGVLRAIPLGASEIGALRGFCGYAIHSIAGDALGSVVISGFIPLDTNSYSDGDFLYLSDSYTLTPSPGSNARPLARVIAGGYTSVYSDNAGLSGLVYFDGAPNFFSPASVGGSPEINGDETLVFGQDYVLVNCEFGDVTVTLPAIADVTTGYSVTIVDSRRAAGLSNITIRTAPGDELQSSLTDLILKVNGDVVVLRTDGTRWYVSASVNPVVDMAALNLETTDTTGVPTTSYATAVTDAEDPFSLASDLNASLIVLPTGADITVNLPPTGSSGFEARRVLIVCSGNYNCIVYPDGIDTINGAGASLAIAPGESYEFVQDNVSNDWHIASRPAPPPYEFEPNVQSVTSNDTAEVPAAGVHYLADPSAADLYLTLPELTTVAEGSIIFVKNVAESSGNNVIVSADGLDSIDDAAGGSVVLADLSTVSLIAAPDANKWYVLSYYTATMREEDVAVRPVTWGVVSTLSIGGTSTLAVPAYGEAVSGGTRGHRFSIQPGGSGKVRMNFDSDADPDDGPPISAGAGYEGDVHNAVYLIADSAEGGNVPVLVCYEVDA
jgi:hypothetical protein